MKKIFFLLLALLASIYLNAQNQNFLSDKIVIGTYKVTNQGDSLRVMIDNDQKEKNAYIEYIAVNRVNELVSMSTVYIGIKRTRIEDMIDALSYIRDKSKEWYAILSKRNINNYEKEFREVDFPRVNLHVRIFNETYEFWNNRHYIDKASFIKDEDYIIRINISGSYAINQDIPLTLFVDNSVVLGETEINQLILLLKEAGKLCEGYDDIDSLLKE